MSDVRLIDANALRENLSSRYMNELYPDWLRLPQDIKIRIEMLANEFRFAIDHAPTIDAVPVKHAEWINGDYGYLMCPLCGCEHHRRDAFRFDTENDYCPRCGAKMDGGAEDG